MYIIVAFPELNFPIFEAVSLVMIDVCLGYGWGMGFAGNIFEICMPTKRAK
jgi:hypothetical protein